MQKVKYFFRLKCYIYRMHRTSLWKQKLCLLHMTVTWIWQCMKYHTPLMGFTYPIWVHVPLVEYCCPKLIWNENTILWCSGEPGTYSALNLNHGMIQRITASCFVALQSSSCLSRIQPVHHPKCITHSSHQQEVLLPTLLEEQPLPLAPWIPNIPTKLQTAVSVVNLLASHPQKLTKSEFEALVC